MALRVLLADESLNIKKNMQITLQDYGVEIKTLLNGDDVLSYVKTFKPDIIFLDVLLPKINGYDACSQLKNHPDFRHIPVVLMWSSFMDIDENKFRQSRADDRLEKPFEKLTLRKLVQHFAPKTKTQGISEFLTLPQLRSEESFHQELNLASPRISNFEEEPDEFRPGPSPFQSTVPEISPLTTQNEDEEEWVPRSLKTKSVPRRVESLTEKSRTEDRYEVEIASIQLPEENSPSASPDLDTLPLMGRPRRPTSPPPQYMGPPPQIQLDQKQLDDLVRSELRPIIEQALAKVLPEIAERVIREEIARIMKETDLEY